MTTQLRMTVWPGQPIPLPLVPVHDLEVRTVDSGTWFLLADTPPRMVDLPVDFYLREPFEVPDLSDDVHPDVVLDAVTRFARKWGRFSDPENREIGRTNNKVNIELADYTGWISKEFGELRDAKEAAIEELELLPPEAFPIRGRGLAYRFEWWKEVEAAVNRLVSPFELLERLTSLQWISEDVKKSSAANGSNEDMQIGVANLLHLNEALSMFSVRVLTGGASDDYLQTPSAYTVAALQIANDIADHAEVKICANEKCGRPFTKQRGRADYGEYRSKGVLYCSKSCALAQTQRDRRRRLKAHESEGVAT